jgi:hypothetical protein
VVEDILLVSGCAATAPVCRSGIDTKCGTYSETLSTKEDMGDNLSDFQSKFRERWGKENAAGGHGTTIITVTTDSRVMRLLITRMTTVINRLIE